ncbi:MAG: HAMP domain-containing histidine kinase [Cyanobacteria bacterium NC_groundwater_1444_Ag_S-0.65um_54_12]|nr:HAMP domain-containing histidine kinase [Cyanobacteria bacterium NC_groundwater_1444_Ag_S-0.65um_54_12]
MSPKLFSPMLVRDDPVGLVARRLLPNAVLLPLLLGMIFLWGSVAEILATGTSLILLSLLLAVTGLGTTCWTVAGLKYLWANRQPADETIARQEVELQKARELEHLKDQFLSSLSHKMKTPLSLIIGYAELLQEMYPEEELLENLLRGGRKLTDHINDLLDYSALLGGSLPLYKTEVCLPEIVVNIATIVREEFRHKGLLLCIATDPATPPIAGDSRRITQLLLELLDNARKFTPSGGTIEIRVYAQENTARIDIRDTGVGIAEKDRDQIWEPFGQLDIAEEHRNGSLGLGLTIVKKLVELQDGQVNLESRSGQGSCFSLAFPVA